MPVTMSRTAACQQVCDRIRAEFREMPDLLLTAAQAQRLWRLERQQCDRILGALVDEGFLKCTNRGYSRESGCRTEIPMRP